MNDLTPRLEMISKGVALIELRNPKSANRLQIKDLQVLQDHLTTCEAQQELCVIVLASEGEIFSAGFDLNDLKKQAEVLTKDELREEPAFELFANRLANSRLVTIAALSGLAVGGATDLVLACDIRIGNKSAGLLMPAARFGLPLYASALQRYVTHFGLSRAKALIFTGREIGAEELLEIGILFEIVPNDALRTACIALATQIEASPPAPLAAMKAALAEFACNTVDKAAVRAMLFETFDGPAIIARIEKGKISKR
jgi:enoyl-CoA hydratase/carnithine racemase